MKTFKHIISYACDKNCSYCINEVLAHDEKQEKDTMTIAQRYDEMKMWGYDHIMISGGEPVLNKTFPFCISYAGTVFDKVSVISAHKTALNNEHISAHGDDILFSFHAEYLDVKDLPKVEIDVPVFVSMVVETFDMLLEEYDKPLFVLQEYGYSGATIRECYPNGKKLPSSFIKPHNFSLRTHGKNNCVAENTLMLPDLSLTTQKEFA